MYRAGDGQRQQWISAIETHQQIDMSHSRIMICELHFDSNSIKKRKDRNILEKGTHPTIFPDLTESIIYGYEF